LEIKADTLVTIGDSTGDQFDFEILNFTPINCGHAANKPYLLRASSRDERDMWVSAPVVTSLTDRHIARECFAFCFAL
jgi:hypothetical protein